MYIAPSVIASYRAADLLGEAYGGSPFGDDNHKGNGSDHHVD